MTLNVTIMGGPPITFDIIRWNTVAFQPPYFHIIMNVCRQIVKEIFPEARSALKTYGCHRITNNKANDTPFNQGRVMVSVLRRRLEAFWMRIYSFYFPVSKVCPSIMSFFPLTGRFRAIVTRQCRPSIICRRVTFTIFSCCVTKISTKGSRVGQFTPESLSIIYPCCMINSTYKVMSMVPSLILSRFKDRSQTITLFSNVTSKFPIRRINKVPSRRAQHMVRDKVNRVMVLALASSKKIKVITYRRNAQDDLYRCASNRTWGRWRVQGTFRYLFIIRSVVCWFRDRIDL